MKILLTTLNSQYVHSNPALKYLYTVLEDTPDEVFLREFTINNEYSYVYGELVRADCDLVCFSCYIWNIEMIRNLAADLKKAKPHVMICLGGPEVSYEAHVLAMENPWIDFILCGEGEYSLYRLCQVLRQAGGEELFQGTNVLRSFGTKFAADNWMHKSMGIQLGLTDSLRCQLPEGTDGTGYWRLTVYALGYADYSFVVHATDANIVKPSEEPADTTALTKEVETAKALAENDYTKATWAAMQTELQEAEELLAREDATQAEVDEALEHLKAAEAALVKVTVTLDKTSATIYTGKTVTLKATSNDTAKTVTYTTSNKAVATVSSTGVVKGVKAGTAVITANCGNATATCKVTVKAPYVKFAKKSAVVYKGKTATVKATLAGVSSVTYKSSNTKIATVNSKTGTVKGIKAGTVTITATSGKLKATYKLTVKNPTFTLTKSSATIAKGKTTTIKSKAAPASKVTYISSNRKVATVTSKGVVKGIRKGKATITVKCNGITKKFVVTVK